MEDFNFDNASNDQDHFMNDDPFQVHEPELEIEPEHEIEPDQDLPIPSIERTASVIASSPVRANDTSSTPTPIIKDEASSQNTPQQAERQVSDDSVEIIRTPKASRDSSVQLPPTASPQRRIQYSSVSSLTPMIASTSIFGGPLHPPALSSTSVNGGSINHPQVLPSAATNGGSTNHAQAPASASVNGPSTKHPPAPSASSTDGDSVKHPLVPSSSSTDRGSTKNPQASSSSSMNGGPVKQLSTHVPTSTKQKVVINVENDDDLVIISPHKTSLAARQKWDAYTYTPRAAPKPDDDVVCIKEEKRDGTALPAALPAHKPNSPARRMKPPLFKRPDPAKMIAAQRKMVQRNQGSFGNGEGSSKGHMRATPARNFEDFDDATFGTSDQMDTAMGGTVEDNSWMDEEEDDVDELYEGWIKLRNELLRKQRTGKIKQAESLQLFKVKQSIETRDRVRAALKADENEDEDQEQDPDSLFLAESREQTIQRRRLDRLRQESADRILESQDRVDSGGEYDDNEGMTRMFAEEDGPRSGPGIEEDLGLTKAGKPRKRRMKAAKNPLEYINRQAEQRREKERAKARKKKVSDRKVKSPVQTRGKGKTKATSKGKKGKGKAKGKDKEIVTNGQSLLASGNFRKFEKNNDAAAHMILEDLMNNDPIEDRLQNPIFNRPAEDEIVGPQKKHTQFQRLFANIPEPENAVERGAVRSDKARLKDASKSFGYAKCKAVNGKWLIKGMKSTLYHHQLLGAQWMVKRELSSQAPHGGILADSMGLGKTVQTLACMVGNPPGDGDLRRGVKAQLIVGPATICSQWIDEIRVHVQEKIFPKIIYYKAASDLSVAVLEDADIVVASYNTVCRQFPFPDKEGKMEIARDGYQSWSDKAVENMGVLHLVNWYRVVLDEAHNIKNNSSRTSLACQNLKSVYRWCLTGTPLLNRLEELFPYLRFLKANYSMDWQMFQKYFCDPNHNDSNSRIATLLSYTMMRRTMKTSILNRPIIVLPRPRAEIKYVKFSVEETIIYRITENRFRNNLNAYFQKGDASHNYGVFMVQLLRLRQCTSHPFMLERTIKESWTMEDVQELKKLLGKFQTNGKPFYEQCKLWVETNEAHRAAARARGENVADDEMLPFGHSNYGHEFDISRALKTLNETELYERVTCSICADVPINAQRTDCGHIFCKDCIETYVAQLVAQDDEYMTCYQCNRVFEKIEPVPGPDPESAPSRGSKTRSKARGKGKGKERQRDNSQADDEEDDETVQVFSKGRDLMGFEPKATDSTWVTKSDTDANFPLTPSTKTAALKALLLKGFEEAPLDKVVIYVQFRTLARIVGRICNAERWGFLYLTGDSSLEHREKAIKRFRDDDEAKILVAGLKCGGLGLNFPFANRCISLDLWWNHAVEQQAFGRIFRIGQKKETHMTRIVVRNSVDMRMLAMQLHKLQNIDKAMPQGGETRERQALSLQQLTRLFGFLKTDSDGEIVSVEADYQSDDDDEDGDGNGSGRGGFSYRRGGASQDTDEDMDGGNGEGSSGGGRRQAQRGELSNWDDVGIEGYDNRAENGYGDVMEVEDEDEDI
ncbi:hypothetical protein VTL71DRAFT_2081 [Oculimacula yallundae]|uniref:Uncharacterized protein n=1 Tax=Oculimacula yallundae TaxID=86028 RepID=A0ABR4C8E5_9HELO